LTVFDASALVNLLLDDGSRNSTRPLFDHDVYAPEILVPETINAFKRMVTTKQISRARAREKVALLSMLPVDLIPMQRLALDVWELSATFSTYDACYVSVARRFETTLLTRDRKLATAAMKFVDVRVVN
jgi:predicted nucleic acid-binding protein